MIAETAAEANKLEPTIAAKAVDGKAVVLGSKTADKPQFVYFVMDGCPCSYDAEPLFHDLYKHLDGKIDFVSVTNADAEKAKEWFGDLSVPYPVVSRSAREDRPRLRRPRRDLQRPDHEGRPHRQNVARLLRLDLRGHEHPNVQTSRNPREALRHQIRPRNQSRRLRPFPTRASSSLGRLSAAGSRRMHRADVTAVLSGGGAATLYAPKAHQTRDLDFILHSAVSMPEAKPVFDLGFSETKSRGVYAHPDLYFTVEFLPGPLAVGDAVPNRLGHVGEGWTDALRHHADGLRA